MDNQIQIPKVGKFIKDTLSLLPSSKFLHVKKDSIRLVVEKSILLDVNSTVIKLVDKINLLDKLQSSINSEIGSPSTKSMHLFLNAISSKVVRLNHVGVSYYCKDIKEQLKMYEKVLQKTTFKLYHESDDTKDQKWFFIGNTTNWESPLIEIVLNTSENPAVRKWVPHVQIDIDTTLSVSQLESMLNEYFGRGFGIWKLNIPKHGVVLEMELLGEYKGIKIALGVGTNLRDTKYHRQKMLKEVYR